MVTTIKIDSAPDDMHLTANVIELKAHGPANIFDLTDQVDNVLAGLEFQEGIVHLFSVGSTGCLIRLNDQDLAQSFLKKVTRMISWNEKHRHPGNAFAHLRSSFLGNELWLDFRSGRLNTDVRRPMLLENTAGRKRRPLVISAVGGNMISEHDFDVFGNGWVDIVNISAQLQRFAQNEGQGLLYIETVAPQTALATIEYEPALILDTADFLAGIFDDVPENSKGNVAAAFMPQSMTIPFKDKRLQSGIWQQATLIDFGSPGPKQIRCRIISES